jgi:hypothetical protein
MRRKKSEIPPIIKRLLDVKHQPNKNHSFQVRPKKWEKKGWAFENQNACQSGVLFSRLPAFPQTKILHNRIPPKYTSKILPVLSVNEGKLK